VNITVDFTVGVLVFLFSFIVAYSILAAATIPQPHTFPTKAEPIVPTVIADTDKIIVESTKVVRVWVVLFKDNGAYEVVSGNTPLRLKGKSWRALVVFTMTTVVYYTGPLPKGYITRHGVSQTEPEPPYIFVGHGVKVVNRS